MSDDTNNQRPQRDASGHFIKGNTTWTGRNGRTNGRSQYERERLAALEREITPDKWQKICRVAYQDATESRDGRIRELGRRWISDYIIGKPKQIVALEAKPPDPFEEFRDYSIEQLRAIASGGDSAGDAEAGGTTGASAPSID